MHAWRAFVHILLTYVRKMATRLLRLGIQSFFVLSVFFYLRCKIVAKKKNAKTRELCAGTNIETLQKKVVRFWIKKYTDKNDVFVVSLSSGLNRERLAYTYVFYMHRQQEYTGAPLSQAWREREVSLSLSIMARTKIYNRVLSECSVTQYVGVSGTQHVGESGTQPPQSNDANFPFSSSRRLMCVRF